MKVNRVKFVRHLERIACAGQIKEVVFHGGFAAHALTPDQLLFISAPGLDGAEPLPKEIGVSDLSLFIKALKLLPGEGNVGVEVDVYVDDANQLVVDDSPRGVVHLMTAKPATIATRVEDENAEKMLDIIPDEDGAPLPRSTVEGAGNAFALLKADEIEIVVGKKSGLLRIGTTKTHRVEFALDDVNSGKADEFTLLFGEHLKDVFSVVTDFSSAQLLLCGEKKPAVVVDGEYAYILSPRSRSAEEGKPAMKPPKAKAKEAAAAEPAGEVEAPDKGPRSRRGRRGSSAGVAAE